MRHATPLLLFVVTSLVLNAGPAAAADYEAAVDITFPVAGKNSFIRDYDHARSGDRTHRATDIMAPDGANVHAAMGGTITWITGLDGNPPSYGYMISIRGDDGRKYSYVHLGRQDGPPSGAYAPGIRDGARVERGQHIGFNGCSGNASCSAPHLHFEIHDDSVTDPYGGTRIDPYASLAAALERGDVPGEVADRVPVYGDWDGDGDVTPGFFSAGRWTFYDDFEATEPYWTLNYGRAGDKPVVGDWDGDGVDTVGVVRGNKFILRNVYRSGADDIVMYYGRDTDKPVVGDWDGNGTDTLGVVRDTKWILRNVYRSGADDIIFIAR